MNKIGWCDLTISPITGCLNNCDYCYARKMAYRLKGRFGYPKDEPFRPTFHFDKLAAIHGLKGKGKRVFLDSMGDCFSPGMDREWIWAIIDAIRHKPEHTFLVLTKRPDRMDAILEEMIGPMPRNLWFGVSVTCQEDVWRIPKLINRAYSQHAFVSFEPLHGLIQYDLSGIDWAIVGLESGNRKGKIWGKQPWIDAICRQADELSIPVYLKNGLTDTQKLGRREEFPPEMR